MDKKKQINQLMVMTKSRENALAETAAAGPEIWQGHSILYIVMFHPEDGTCPCPLTFDISNKGQVTNPRRCNGAHKARRFVYSDAVLIAKNVVFANDKGVCEVRDWRPEARLELSELTLIRNDIEKSLLSLAPSERLTLVGGGVK